VSDIEIGLTKPTGGSTVGQLHLGIGIALLTPEGSGEAYRMAQLEDITVVCIASIDAPVSIPASIEAPYVVDSSQETPVLIVASEDSNELVEATTDTSQRVTATFGG
jgi:hypothetical protein